MNMDQSSNWRLREESISLERLDGETILINFDSGEYFSFRGSAADILWLIDMGVDRSHWSVILASAFPNLLFDHEIALQVEDFLQHLLEANVIIASSTGGIGDVTLPDDYKRDTWSRPTVDAINDLADLLVIDPIHDVGDDGWPHTQSH